MISINITMLSFISTNNTTYHVQLQDKDVVHGVKGLVTRMKIPGTGHELQIKIMRTMMNVIMTRRKGEPPEMSSSNSRQYRGSAFFIFFTVFECLLAIINYFDVVWRWQQPTAREYVNGTRDIREYIPWYWYPEPADITAYSGIFYKIFIVHVFFTFLSFSHQYLQSRRLTAFYASRSGL